MKTRIYLLLVMALQLPVVAQINDDVFESISKKLDEQQRRHLYSARDKFNYSFYGPAIKAIDSIDVPDLKQLSFVKGVFYAYDEDLKSKSLPLIKQAAEEQDKIDGYYFHKAFAESRLDSFARAIDDYKAALVAEQAKKHPGQKLMTEINLRIEQCGNILAMRNRMNQVEIKSFGSPVNSEYSEYCPIITSNEDIMVFTYRGPRSTGGKQKIEAGIINHEKVELYFEDIFVTQKINDTLWSEPQPIPNLNSQEHDAAICLNSDGTEMFVYKNHGRGNGDLYLTTLKGDTWSKPIKQHGLNSSEWDGSACFIPNSNKIIISSERKGGYGGKDLYYAEKIGENTWGNITNLGPVINTQYDEDAPFVTTDGKILFFSTNNQSSLGGYDIERSDLVNGFWSKPYNLGPPINTVNDDGYITVRADGRVAYFSSSQKTGSREQDIYTIKPGIPGKPVAMLQVEGIVNVDGLPAEAEIEIRAVEKNTALDFYVRANSATGKFLCNLASKDEYELTVHVPNFPPQIISLNTNNIDSFIVLNVYSDFYSAERGGEDHIQHAKEYTLQHYNEVESEMLSKFGDIKKENVTYKVQLGAYKFPKAFDYNHFIGLPKIVRTKDSLGVFHFTCGEFRTYAEARVLLDKVRASVPDAFVVVYNMGRRYSLGDQLSDLRK